MTDYMTELRERIWSHAQIILDEQAREYGALINVHNALQLDFSYAAYIPTFEVYNLDQLAENEKKLTAYAKRLRNQWKYKNAIRNLDIPVASELGDASYTTVRGKKLELDGRIGFSSLNQYPCPQHDAYHSFNLATTSGGSATYLALATALEQEGVNANLFGFASSSISQRVLQSIQATYHVALEQYQEQEWHTDIEKFSVYFLESLLQNQEFVEPDWGRLLSVLETHRKQTKFLVVDSSLQGNTFELESILNRLQEANVVILVTRSLLELEEFGLELRDAGLIQVFLPRRFYQSWEDWGTSLSEKQSAINGRPSYVEYSELDNGLTLVETNDYAKTLLTNSQDLFAALTKNRSSLLHFKHVKKAPYILVQVAEKSVDIFRLTTDLMSQLNGQLLVKARYGSRQLSLVNQGQPDHFALSPGIHKSFNFWSLVEIWDYLSNLSENELSELDKQVQEALATPTEPEQSVAPL